MKKINLVGQKFGRLAVVTEWGRNNNGCITWMCICDCGEYVIIKGGSLRENATRSCGCLHREKRCLGERFWSKVDVKSPSECWPWLAAVRKSSEGYGAFWVDGRHHPASRIAYILTFGAVPAKLEVLHHCDNPNCCNPHHLFVGTNLDNVRDRVNKNRSANGIKTNSRSKLTEQDVLLIREIVAKKKMTQRAIAKALNVGDSCVSNVIKGRTYAYYY